MFSRYLKYETLLCFSIQIFYLFLFLNTFFVSFDFKQVAIKDRLNLLNFIET